MPRYARLFNGFSRKVQNHEAAVALNYLVALSESYEREAERAA